LLTFRRRNIAIAPLTKPRPAKVAGSGTLTESGLLAAGSTAIATAGAAGTAAGSAAIAGASGAGAAAGSTAIATAGAATAGAAGAGAAAGSTTLAGAAGTAAGSTAIAGAGAAGAAAGSTTLAGAGAAGAGAAAGSTAIAGAGAAGAGGTTGGTTVGTTAGGTTTVGFRIPPSNLSLPAPAFTAWKRLAILNVPSWNPVRNAFSRLLATRFVPLSKKLTLDDKPWVKPPLVLPPSNLSLWAIPTSKLPPELLKGVKDTLLSRLLKKLLPL
jgi:hypothetical protein